MKHLYYILIILFCLIHLCFGQTIQIEIAENGLQSFLNRMPKESITDYGFYKDDSIQNAYLGKPFNLFSIHPSSILNFRSSDSIDTIISSTYLWYFPVMINDDIRSILIVDKVDNRWEAVSFGYSKLAIEIAKMIEEWPEEMGYNPIIIAVLKLNQYYFSIPEIDKNNLTLLNIIHFDKNNLKKKSHSSYKYLNKLSIEIEILKSKLEVQK